MTLYQGILLGRILLLVALAGLLFTLARRGVISRRQRAFMFVLLVGALASYANFGILHPNQSGYRPGHIHYYDTFHYFMGAKYLPELGYSGLYEATIVAGRELGAFGGITYVRDLTTYVPRPTTTVAAEPIRSRFSAGRWEAFKRDLAFFGPRIDAWPELLVDRGYNDPPPRALLLHLLVGHLAASAPTLALLSSLDYVLMIAAAWAVWRSFGAVPAALTLTFLSLSFYARFDYIGGSILRWDWVAALLAGAAALARGAGTTGGLLLGYAAAARVFPTLFLVPLLIKWTQARVSRRPEPVVTSGLRAAVGLLLAISVGLLAWPDQRPLVLEFLAKIRLHAQDPFVNSVGLGSMLVFGAAPWSTAADGAVFVPAEAIAAARPATYLLPLLSAGYLLAALPLILRARSLESMTYAVPLVFCAFSLTGYYYGFLALLVLLPWHEGRADRISIVEMALLAVIMASAYAFEFASADLLPLFYQASIQLGLFLALWTVFEYVRLTGTPTGATTCQRSQM
jgi:hypothetical protein